MDHDTSSDHEYSSVSSSEEEGAAPAALVQEAPKLLASVKRPPLRQDDKRRLAAYFASGTVKAIVAVALLVVITTAITRVSHDEYSVPSKALRRALQDPPNTGKSSGHLNRSLLRDESCTASERTEKLACIVLASINAVILIVSAVADFRPAIMVVFTGAQRPATAGVESNTRWLLNRDDVTSSGSTDVFQSPNTRRRMRDEQTFMVYTFMTSQFARKHRLHVFMNRTVMVLGIMLGTFSYVPGMNQAGCNSEYMAVVDDPQSANSFLRKLGSVLDEIVHNWYTSIFGLGVIGSFTYHMTAHLWHSHWWTAYGILSHLRFCFGCLVSSLAVRFISALVVFVYDASEGYATLPEEYRRQSMILLRWLTTVSVLGGAVGIVTGASGIGTSWRRSKVLVLYDVLIATISLTLTLMSTMSFGTIFSLNSFFCNYDYYFLLPSDSSHFASDLCDALENLYHIRVEFGLIITISALCLISLLMGLVLLAVPQVAPLEWGRTKDFVMSEIRARRLKKEM